MRNEPDAAESLVTGGDRPDGVRRYQAIVKCGSFEILDRKESLGEIMVCGGDPGIGGRQERDPGLVNSGESFRQRADFRDGGLVFEDERVECLRELGHGFECLCKNLAGNIADRSLCVEASQGMSGGVKLDGTAFFDLEIDRGQYHLGGLGLGLFD